MTPVPPLPPKPRQARGAVARDRVYEAALRRFAQHGVEATRIEDVVADAGVAWGTFYRWFPRKQDVLLEVAVRHVRERVAPAADAGLDDPDRTARDTALRLFTALLDPGEHPEELFGAVLHDVLDHRARFTAMLDDGEQPLIVLVARTIAHGQARGELRTDLDEFTLAGALFAGAAMPVIHGYYGAFRGMPGVRPAADPRDLTARFFGIAWRGLEVAPEPIAPGTTG